MPDPKVVIIVLRQPNRSDPNEMRPDPFWEFGSFGCTGCHKSNVLNPIRAHSLQGTRLAFAQGGKHGFKLVFVTPPVQIVRHRDICEANWHPSHMPLRYDRAPVLINNVGFSDVPGLIDQLVGVHRSTCVAKFASKFRSRCEPVSSNIARQLISVYEKYSRKNAGKAIAASYSEALPFPPRKFDANRRRTYESFLRSA